MRPNRYPEKTSAKDRQSMKLESLSQLFVEQLQDLYSAETQILKALPTMAEKSHSPELRQAFELHLRQTRDQVKRLDRIFDDIGKSVRRDGKTCEGMEGIIEEGKEIVNARGDEETRDAGMIAAAQRVEHYEIAGYGTARNFAKLLGHEDWARLLQQTLDEEKETDGKLTKLSERINVEARAA
jgi:ferritin-like metal-binding protein YciE